MNIFKSLTANDKRALVAIAMFYVLTAGVAGASLYERITYGNNYQVVATQEQEESVSVTLTLPNLSAGTSTILADLSDNVMFPHTQSSGAIVVSRINFSWEAENTTASSTIKVGVVASTSPSGAVSDINYFDTVSFNAANGTYQRQELNYSPSMVKLALSGATTTEFATNDKSLSNTGYATTTKITSPKGSYSTYPGVGDLVLTVYDQRGNATTTAQAFYHVVDL